MEIKQETKNNISIFRLSGNLALMGVREAKSVIMPILEDESTTTVLYDMQNIQLLDSSGIGFLISSSKTMTKKKGVFGLFSCNEMVGKIIETTNISSVINVYNNEIEALKDN